MLAFQAFHLAAYHFANQVPTNTTPLAPHSSTQWVFSRPVADSPYLLSVSDYTITSATCTARFIDCIVDSRNSFGLWHFPHAAESQLACWSLFRQHPDLIPRFALGPGVRFSSTSRWTRGMMRLINATETTTSDNSSCAVKGSLRTRRKGWAGSEQSWLIATADAVALSDVSLGLR